LQPAMLAVRTLGADPEPQLFAWVYPRLLAPAEVGVVVATSAVRMARDVQFLQKKCAVTGTVLAVGVIKRFADCIVEVAALVGMFLLTSNSLHVVVSAPPRGTQGAFLMPVRCWLRLAMVSHWLHLPFRTQLRQSSDCSSGPWRRRLSLAEPIAIVASD